MSGQVLLLVGLLSAASSQGQNRMDFAVLQESLCPIPPKHRAAWLRSRGLDDSYYTAYRAPSDSGLRMVGKYGRGPSFSVTGADSVVLVALGSEVAVVDVASPLQPRVLTEIQLGFLPVRVRVSDTLMLVGGNGIEVWNVAAPSNPQFLSRIPHAVSDFCIRDSLVFLVSRDTFVVYNVADPASPARLGTCADSGYAVSVAGNTVVLMRLSGLGFIDVAEPRHPMTVGSHPGYFWSAAARGSICCVTVGNPNQPTWLQLQVLDVSNPAAVFRLGSLDSAGGYNLVIEDSLVFASGFYTGGHEFQVVSIRDSTRPVAIGALLTHGDNWDVWVNRPAGEAYVADRTQGLALIDIDNPAQPMLDTAILRADMAYDVDVQGRFAYVADYSAGLKVLDLSDPARPVEVGALDTMAALFTSTSVAVRDSFVFAAWWPQPKFRTISVADPLAPTQAGGCNTFDQAQDIVVRETLAYLAERLRFQVVNVAQPRQPVLVGSCNLPGNSGDLFLQDTVAYVTNSGLFFISVADPTAPVVVGSWPGWVLGVEAVNSVAYCSGVYFFATLDVSDFAAPRVLDSLWLVDNLYDVAVIDTLAYAGGNLLRVFNCANPEEVRQVASWTPPYSVRRIVYEPPHLYVACWDAGVCVLETTATGIAESPRPSLPAGPVRIAPNPTSARIVVRGQRSPVLGWRLSDVAGRVLLSEKGGNSARRMEADLTKLGTGVYFLEVSLGTGTESVKIVKR